MKRFIGMMLVTGLISGAARGDERDDYRNMIRNQKTQQEGYIKNLTSIGDKKIEEIVKVSLDEGKLAIKSPLFTSEAVANLKNRQVRAKVAGFEGLCTIMVQPIANDAYYFTFSNMQYPNMEGVSNLVISMQPGHLQISKNFNSRYKNFNVNLIQSTGRANFGMPDGVQFSVYGGDNTGRMSTSVNLSEPDFITLRRKHPREVNEYLRPLMRDLRLENIFTVDSTTAWQVFADEWKGNPDVAKHIRELLPALEVDAYRDREAARQAIRKLGPDAALVIYRMNRGGLTPEQNCQLDAVVAMHSFLSRADAARLVGDIDFLLDCLYSDDADVRSTAMKHLQKVAHRELNFDSQGDYDSRVTRVEALRGELGRGPATKPSTQPAKG